jgi:hypothetical protein
MIRGRQKLPSIIFFHVVQSLVIEIWDDYSISKLYIRAFLRTSLALREKLKLYYIIKTVQNAYWRLELRCRVALYY